MARLLEDWVTAFEEFTAPTATPMRLRTWAGIACIAGALERKVWVHTAGSNLYPNMFTILVAPPGVGKSRVLEIVRKLWMTLPEHKVAHSSVTKASLVDELRDSQRVIVRPTETPATIEFHSLKILSSELGVLLPEFANDFMNTLTDLYDGTPYGERRRTKDLQFNIEKPQLNMIAGTTPSYLNNLLPEGAWDQGFLSRTVLIYSGDNVRQSLFTKRKADEAVRKVLEKELIIIGKTYGEITFTEEAAEAIDGWYLNGCKPAPDHPKLQHYLTRRAAHVLKLCMVACMSMGDTPVITIEHFHRALGWLIEAEHYLPDVFKSMATGGDAKAIEECWYFCYQYVLKLKKSVPEARLFQFLQERVPAHSVERIISVMVKGGLLKEDVEKNVGVVYKPQEKHKIE